MVRNWSIKNKIAAAIGVGVVCSTILAVLSFINTAHLIDVNERTDQTYKLLGAGSQLLLHLRTVEGSTRGYFVMADPQYLQPFHGAEQALPQDFATLRKMTADLPAVQTKINEMEELAKARLAVAHQAIEALDKRGIDGARDVIRKVNTKKMMDALLAKQGEIDSLAMTELAAEQQSGATWALITKISNVGGGLIAFLLSISAGMWLIRSITQPLDQATGLIEAVASGDLTAKAVEMSNDEFGLLIRTLNQMANHLSSTMASVSTASEQVTEGSDEMRATAQKLSQGATEQAAAAEETTSAMEQMASSVHQNADNAKQTDRIASKAAADARESGQAVSETVRLMKTVAGTIGVIEEIARKTDLLALNAAVEAARAGEHGRGFAVVASEVRKLAERSQAAAGEIGRMTNEGVRTAETAGQLLQKLVPDIQRTAELVREIAAASAEQNTGTAQVNQAIQQLDQVIQQNAAAAEQMAATAEELSGQSQSLQSSIAYFKLDGGHRSAAPIVRKRLGPSHGTQVSGARHATRSLMQMNHAVGGSGGGGSRHADSSGELDFGATEESPAIKPREAFATDSHAGDALDKEFAEFKS